MAGGGERGGVHRRVHLTGIEGDETKVCLFHRPHSDQMVQRNLGGAIDSPTRVGVDGRIAADDSDGATVFSHRAMERPDKTGRPQRVDLEDLLQTGGIHLVQTRHRIFTSLERAERTRGVHDEIERTFGQGERTGSKRLGVLSPDVGG